MFGVKRKTENAIYADITWCGYIENSPPEKYVEIFNLVCKARDRAIEFIQEKFSKGEPCYG
jgi:Xaa-Pro aminopeptidase